MITVDGATQEFLVAREEELLLRPLTEAERREVIASYVDDEVLVREARKRGLDDSSRVRRLLVQNMRFFYAGSLPEPSEETLRAHFDAHPERFAAPASITYEQVFFQDSASVPAGLLDALRAGADHTRLGDRGMAFGSRLPKIDRREIAASFGPEVAPAVLAIADERWHGPFPSTRGVHFLRVVERHPEQRVDFDAARSWIASDWTLSRQREILEAEIATLREGYRVEILGPDEVAE